MFVIYLFLNCRSVSFCLLVDIVVYKVLLKDRQKIKYEFLENNIIFRNSYYALCGIYLAKEVVGLSEVDEEKGERETFESTKEYKDWEDKNRKKHPEWTSWNYGLSISWDNNPDKAKTGESAPETPTDLSGSESTPEDPKRQEP